MEHSAIEQQLKRNSRVTLQSHKSSIHIIRWNPDGNILASGGKDKQLNIHRVKEAEIVVDPQNSIHGHTSEIDHICWNMEEPHLVATAALDRTLKIWDVRYVEPIANVKLKNETVSLSWSSSGTDIAVADKADVVSFIDPKAGFKIGRDQKFQYEICELAWNKECDFLYIATGDGKLHLYSYPDLQNFMIIDAFGSSCGCLRFDKTGKYFALGSNDAISSVWENENLACITSIDRLESPVRSISFSHDSRYIASGSADDHILDVADILTGEQVVAVELGDPCLSLDFHPKDYILAYALNEHDYRDMGSIKIVGFPDRRPKIYA